MGSQEERIKFTGSLTRGGGGGRSGWKYSHETKKKTQQADCSRMSLPLSFLFLAVDGTNKLEDTVTGKGRSATHVCLP